MERTRNTIWVCLALAALLPTALAVGGCQTSPAPAAREEHMNSDNMSPAGHTDAGLAPSPYPYTE
jgi:hypothetical protein